MIATGGLYFAHGFSSGPPDLCVFELISMPGRSLGLPIGYNRSSCGYCREENQDQRERSFSYGFLVREHETASGTCGSLTHVGVPS